MPRPITKNQLANLWVEEFSSTGHCVLCGNHGIIDSRGKVFTPAGHECGDKVFCICPNGRAMKKARNMIGTRGIKKMLELIGENIGEYATRHPTSIEQYGDGWVICFSVGVTLTVFYDTTDGYRLYQPQKDPDDDRFDPMGEEIFKTQDYEIMAKRCLKFVPEQYRK